MSDKPSADPEPTVGWAEALGPAVDNPPGRVTTNGYHIHTRDKDGQLVAWVVPALQNRIKAQFELWVRQQALESIVEVDMLNEQQADAMRSVYQTDYTNGYYKWDDNFDGKKVRSARQSSRGAMHLLYLLMRQAHPTLTEERALEVFSANPKDAVAAYLWALGNVPAPANGSAGAKVKTAADGVQLTPEELQRVMDERQRRARPQTMDQDSASPSSSPS